MKIILKARNHAEKNEFMQATQVLTAVLLDSRHKKLFAKDPELKASITTQRDEFKETWWKTRGF